MRNNNGGADKGRGRGFRFVVSPSAPSLPSVSFRAPRARLGPRVGAVGDAGADQVRVRNFDQRVVLRVSNGGGGGGRGA